MAAGTVKWFDTRKGHGFIRPDAGSRDVFADVCAIWQSGIGRSNDGRKIGCEFESGRNDKISAAALEAP